MFINDTFYKETDSLIEILFHKILFKRKVVRIGNEVYIEFL